MAKVRSRRMAPERNRDLRNARYWRPPPSFWTIISRANRRIYPFFCRDSGCGGTELVHHDGRLWGVSRRQGVQVCTSVPLCSSSELNG
jgi:hypothetical protein